MFLLISFLMKLTSVMLIAPILGISEKEGFNFTQSEVKNDGSIRLVLRRFN